MKLKAIKHTAKHSIGNASQPYLKKIGEIKILRNESMPSHRAAKACIDIDNL